MLCKGLFALQYEDFSLCPSTALPLMGGLSMGKHIQGRQNRVGIGCRGEWLGTNGQIGSDSLTPMGHSLQGVYEALACVATSAYE